MKSSVFVSAFLLSLILALPIRSEAAPWPAWRGDILGSGVTSEIDLPTEWDKEKNIRWRVELPEGGNSTPVVYGDYVFVTQAISEKHWRGLMCFDRKDGSLRWKNGVIYDKEERTHRTNPYCSASPVTDGKMVIASYGSAGVAAYDFDGQELWRRDFGAIDHVWGNSTSPVIFGDLVIHYHGPAKNAVLYGLDKRTGATVWEWNEPVWEPGVRTDGFAKSEDGGVIGTWCTPIVIEFGGRIEMIMGFPLELKAFDPANGKELWTCRGLNPLVYCSQLFFPEKGIVVVMGGFYGNSMGVKVGGNGDVTDTHRLWHEIRHHGGIGTGVVKDGLHYYQNSGGDVFCDDPATGQTIWKDRLPGEGKSWGSFVLSGDRIYTLSQKGDTVVFKASPDGFEVVAQSDVGEYTNSSLAVSDGDLFLRTHEALWCIGK